MREPGVEPGSNAWKASMLTVTPLALAYTKNNFICKYSHIAFYNSLHDIYILRI